MAKKWDIGMIFIGLLVMLFTVANLLPGDELIGVPGGLYLVLKGMRYV